MGHQERLDSMNREGYTLIYLQITEMGSKNPGAQVKFKGSLLFFGGVGGWGSFCATC